ncbi:DnaJ domain-containing protein [Altericista sp. CCNU0014]|uniref:J domain-containing protein n=1 Tax=Altericista sp. CCNU0014 TaxID=3082949 RepID=UPI00384AAC10
MDIIECYRLLELTSAASLEDVKSSYRRLARRLHPDVNPNDSKAHDRFIRITEAYKVLAKIAAARPVSAAPNPAPSPRTSPAPEVTVSVKTAAPPARSHQPPAPPIPEPPAATTTDTAAPELSFADQKLKLDTYRQIEDLIKRRSLPRAIAIIEALQARLPNDPEIRQWQAIIYQRWGRQLIENKNLTQARAYLKKALKTDPHNKSLWTEIEGDFRRIENSQP